MVSTLVCKLIWIAIFIDTISAVCDDPIRYRKAWHSDDAATDRQLYIDGFIELYQQGKIEQFVLQHIDAYDQAHGGAGFLPWHRYYIWELESQIRDLGGQYECFNLPYWDWPYDVNRVEENGFDNLDETSDFHILNSGLGGNGDPTDDWCITDDSPFSKANGYQPVRDCPPEDNNGNCCLKRRTSISTADFTDATQFAVLFANYPQYSQFRATLEGDHHNPAHVRIGGSSGLGQLSTAYSPADPIFFLIHGFVDYIWSLWQDCYNYETLNRLQAATTPAAYQGDEPNTSPNDELDFDVLKSTSWARVRPQGYVIKDPSSVNIQNFVPVSVHQIADMHNIAWWAVKYERYYLYDAVAEWFVDQGIFNCNNLPGVLSTRGGSFANEVWNELVSGLNLGNNTISQATAQSLFSSLGRINCEMRQSKGGREPCKRPKCFDDCSDLLPCDDDSGKDINVTLDELIEKVQGYPCMIETRRTYYDWAKMNGELLELCRGDYDNFCDRYDIQGDSALDTCPVSEKYAEAVLEEYEAAESDGDDNFEPRRGDARGRGGRGKGRGKAYGADSALFEIDDHDGFGSYDKGFEFNYNTLIIVVMFIFNVIGCLYLDNKWKRKLQNEGMKYIDQDDI